MQASPQQSLFRDVFLRTFGISITVTLATLLLGFPVAYLLATLPTKTSNLLMIMVLLPFWTSLLVRTTAWVALLQTEGVINNVLVWTGVFSEPVQLIFNRFGTIVAMTHIQLPFTILPIYSVMKTIPSAHVRAARVQDCDLARRRPERDQPPAEHLPGHRPPAHLRGSTEAVPRDRVAGQPFGRRERKRPPRRRGSGRSGQMRRLVGPHARKPFRLQLRWHEN